MHHPTHHRRGPDGRPRRTAAAIALSLGLAAATLTVPAPASAAGTTFVATGRANVAADGTQAPTGSKLIESIDVTDDGRYVFFGTNAKLAPKDDNGTWDVYVRDRRASTTSLVTAAPDGTSFSPGVSRYCGASSTGRYVGFTSPGPSSNDTNAAQAWILDRSTGTYEVTSVSSSEVPAGNGGASNVSSVGRCPISTDGRYMVFVSSSSTLGAAGQWQVFRRDRVAGLTNVMSMSSASVLGNGASRFPSMSDDGNEVVFESVATNLVPGDTNAKSDAFVRIVNATLTARVSLTDGDAQVTGGDSGAPSIAGGGRYVAFQSAGTDLTPDETGSFPDVYVRDLTAMTTELVSVSSAEVQADGLSFGPDLSPDGRFVTFFSSGKDLYPAKVSTTNDVFLRDRQLGSTTLISRTAGIATGNASSWFPVVSADGKVVAFESDATDLVRKDTNATRDVVVRDLAVDFGPLPTLDRFVDQQHDDFAGRPSSASELTEWKARLTNGEQSPDSTIVAFAHSTAWSAKRAPMVRLYWAFFLRLPDQGGLTFWVHKLNSGWSLAKVAKQFAASSEFQAKYGAKTNAQFVTLIYQNIFDRDPDAGGLAYWTKKLDTHQKTRGDVMVGFSESSEGKRVLAPQADLVLVHLGMLGTMPPTSLATVWLAQAAAGTSTPADLAHALRIGPAYTDHVS